MSAPPESDASRNVARFTSLCVALVGLIAVSPLFHGLDARLLLRIAFTLVLVTCAYAVSGRRAILWGFLAMAGPTVAAEWLSFRGVIPDIHVPLLIAEVLILWFVVAVVLREIVNESAVSLDTVVGGIAVYLLIGVAFSLQFAILENLSPGSFQLNGEPIVAIGEGESRHPVLFYFSFVTITTLGYGDVTPATQAARTMASFEAVVGQLYVAVFVASLVGLYLATDRSRR